MRQMTPEEGNLVEVIDMLTANIKDLATRRDSCLEKLAASTMGDVVTHQGEMIKIGKPAGKWMVFPEWAFTMRRKIKERSYESEKT